MGHLGQMPLPQLHEHLLYNTLRNSYLIDLTQISRKYIGVGTGKQQSRRGNIDTRAVKHS